MALRKPVVHVCRLQVARRKGPDGKLLSMGFGFVETDSEAAAKVAIKALQVSEWRLVDDFGNT
jgi:hypothetical protein